MDTEQEELEALKKWWHDNGRAVVVGLVLGLGGVFGWTTWQSRVEAAAEQLSVVYQNMVETAASENHGEAIQQADRIIADHPDSEYAALAGLVAAKSALAAGQPDDANRFLDWVVENAELGEIRDVARIRRARLLFDTDGGDAGLAILERVDTAAFAAMVDELRGDILVAKRDTPAAAKAYEAALESNTLSNAARARVQIKLDNLGLGEGFGIEQ